MIPFDKIREEKLIQLAQERFNPELWPAEKKVLHDSASSVDPVPPNPEEERLTIRTDFVRWLATDPEAAQNIDPKGLRVWGATLHGKLDFEECRVFPTLYIRQCTLLGDINLMSAEAKGLFITKSDVFGSIQADGITVHGPISLRESTFSGEIRMLGASIESEFSCSGAKLTCQGDALSLDNAKIGNNVFLSEGFESLGAIRLLNTQISGNLECIGAKVAAVYCKNMQVTGDFIWQRIKKSEDAQLKLIGAKVKNLRDDRESWPAEGKLGLDGLVYEELTLHKRQQEGDIKQDKLGDTLPLDAKERIDWLLLQGQDRCTEPQPWMQLRELLETKGDHKGAKHVLFKLKCLRYTRREWHPWLGIRAGFSYVRRILAFLFQRWDTEHPAWPYFRHPNRSWAIAFAWLEEAPARILWSITATVLLGWIIFGYADAKRAIAPTEPEAYMAFKVNNPMPGAYPKLSPLVYTIENTVPLFKLGQDEKWAPDQSYSATNWFTNYWFLMWARWLLILLGWFQAAVLGAALLGRFKE